MTAAGTIRAVRTCMCMQAISNTAGMSLHASKTLLARFVQCRTPSLTGGRLRRVPQHSARCTVNTIWKLVDGGKGCDFCNKCHNLRIFDKSISDHMPEPEYQGRRDALKGHTKCNAHVSCKSLHPSVSASTHYMSRARASAHPVAPLLAPLKSSGAHVCTLQTIWPYTYSPLWTNETTCWQYTAGPL